MNTFLQYKRPEYLRGATAKERSYWPTGIYYRFVIDADQQLALEACSSALASNGLVLYASPAFYRRDDLFKHIETGSLISSTHFVPAAKLKGHTRYTYAKAGTQGQAHSRAMAIDPHIFESHNVRNVVGSDAGPFRTSVGHLFFDASRRHDRHDEMHGREYATADGGGRGAQPPLPPSSGGRDGRSPAEILRDARLAAEAAIAVVPSRVGGVRRFTQRVDAATGALVGLLEQDQPPVRDFITATIFCSLANLRWGVQ